MLFFGPAASFTAHPYLHDKLPYDPRDLAPVARVSATLISLTVPPQLNINSLKELFAMARAAPGKLNWASVTGATDVVIAAFLKREGLDMAKLPYRDPVQALNDVAENRLQFYWSSLAIVRGAIEAKRVKLLAITSTVPSPVVPGVPTAIQEGFPGLTFDGLVGFYGTRDMPNELRERIAADVRQALTDPTIVKRLEAGGQDVVPGSAAEFAADIEKQSLGAAENAKVLGLKAAQPQ
jgi:tripartite-type tricarboxylate transporter receptor subunit TctC